MINLTLILEFLTLLSLTHQITPKMSLCIYLPLLLSVAAGAQCYFQYHGRKSFGHCCDIVVTSFKHWLPCCFSWLYENEAAVLEYLIFAISLKFP